MKTSYEKKVFPIMFSLFIACNTAIEKNEVSAIEEPIVHAEEVLEAELEVEEIPAIQLSDEQTLDNCIDSIWNSTKVQALNNEILELSEGERHLTIIPIEYEEEITVKLAEDNGTNFVTLRTFRIIPSNNWTIEYYDLLEDTYIDFAEWNLIED